MPSRPRSSAPASSRREVDDVHHGLRHARRRDRQQHRAPDRAARRPADHDQRHDRQPLLLERPADHRDGRAAHHRRRGRRLSSPAASRASPACRTRSTSTCSPTRGWSRTSPRSTGTCCRRPSRSPSATSIGRERMDEYGAASQQKACAAQEAGKFKDEIAPITVHGRRRRRGDGPAHQGSDGQRTTKASAPAPPTKASAASSRRFPAA